VKRKVAGAFFIMALLFSAMAGTHFVKVVTSDPVPYLPYIAIKSDGSIEPQTEFIKQIGNVYYLTANLPKKYAILIQCSNITFNGAGHIVNGTLGTSYSSGYRAGNDGLSLQGVTNVTVRDLEITGFDTFDVSIENCVSCIIQRVKANTFSIDNSRLNIISESNIAGNDINVQAAIIMSLSNSNKFYRNSINGIILKDSNSNIFFENNIIFQHTSILGGSRNNLWDNYSIGNYWSDYTGTDGNGDGIGDTPYVINADNQDNYPLMAPTKVPDILPSDMDFTAPTVLVLSPENKNYTTSSILLNFTLNEPASQIKYSLDGSENATIAENITLTELSNGNHNVTIYATDVAGNVGVSETISFIVAVPEQFPTTLVGVSVVTIAFIGGILLVYFKKRKR
jgi:hypothetical protein